MEPVKVVSYSKTLIIPLLVPLIDKFPAFDNLIRNIKNPSEEFDFYMSSAVLERVYSLNSNNDFKQQILIEAEKINKDYLLAIKDLTEFIKKNTEHEMPVTIGLWILWNLKKEFPNLDEIQIALVLGKAIEKIAIDLN